MQDPPIALNSADLVLMTTRHHPQPTIPPIPGSTPDPGVIKSTSQSPSSQNPNHSKPDRPNAPKIPSPSSPHHSSPTLPFPDVLAPKPSISNVIPITTPIAQVGGKTIWNDPSRPSVVFVGDGTKPFQTIHANSDSTVIGGVTIALAKPTVPASLAPLPSTSIQGIPLQRLPDGRVAVGGDLILRPGETADSQGQVMELDETGRTIQFNGVSIPVPSLPAATIANIPFSRLPDGTVVAGDSTILRPGSPAISVQGKNVALSADNHNVIIDGISYALPGLQQPSSTVIGDVPVSYFPGTGVVIINGSHILMPGSPPLILQNHIVSLAPDGSGIIIDGVIHALPTLGIPSSTVGALLLIKNANGTTTTITLDWNSTGVRGGGQKSAGESDNQTPSTGANTTATIPHPSETSEVKKASESRSVSMKPKGTTTTPVNSDRKKAAETSITASTRKKSIAVRVRAESHGTMLRTILGIAVVMVFIC